MLSNGCRGDVEDNTSSCHPGRLGSLGNHVHHHIGAQGRITMSKSEHACVDLGNRKLAHACVDLGHRGRVLFLQHVFYYQGLTRSANLCFSDI